MKKNDLYAYRVIWSEEDKEYVGLCAEFPSLSWLARTQEEALKGIRKIVHDVIADMIRNNESVPDPLSLKKFSGNSLSGFYLKFTGSLQSRPLNSM